MTVKEMKRLSRMELLQILLVQTREVERLTEENEQLRGKLQNRELKVSQAGSIAQAAMAVNSVVEIAQAAADQYLENIAAMEEEAKQRCQAMEDDTRRRCDALLRQAQEAANSQTTEE